MAKKKAKTFVYKTPKWLEEEIRLKKTDLDKDINPNVILHRGRFVWKGTNGDSLYGPADGKDARKLNRQREKTGVGDDETWSLDHTIAAFIVPRLKRFKELYGGVFCKLDENGKVSSKFYTKVQTDRIIDKMIWSFSHILFLLHATSGNPKWKYKVDGKWHTEKWLWDRWHEGMELFHRYFFALWW